MKLFALWLVISLLSFTPKSYLTEYEGDGTYLLHVGDRIRASNGYILELALAWGAFGSRSDWRTDLIIYNPQGVEVEYRGVAFGNGIIVTDSLYIIVVRHVENEAILTVMSKSPPYPEQWIPYIPDAKYVELCYWEQNGVSYVKVLITLSCAGFNVSDWGSPIFEGNKIFVDSEIWMWTGDSAQVIITLSNTYNLGHLHPGEYSFTFKVWGISVKTITFNVGDGNVDADPPGGGLGGQMPLLR